tara:strand:+ start:58 stop:498 length:441 start_codon:yes stop_codon:yes gene_type:complete
MENTRTENVNIRTQLIETSDIKNIMIRFGDNDFRCVWAWIGKVLYDTMTTTNENCHSMLEDSHMIEDFVHSLIPTAIEFTQYRTQKYDSNGFRYREITREELARLTEYFSTTKFIYNFDKETDDNWKYGDSDALIIDLVTGESFVH